MTKPCDAPENLPSVIKAHCPPRPAPISAPVGVSISGMPGPPLGPSYLITTTVPCSQIQLTNHVQLVVYLSHMGRTLRETLEKLGTDALLPYVEDTD